MALSKIDESSWGGTHFGRRNVLYNGNMEVNQRGVTSYTGLTGFTRGCDGWQWAKNDSVNFDAEYDTFSTSFTDIPGARGYMSFTLNSAGSGTDFVTIQQRIEDVRTLAGEEVTLTFWARSNTGSSFTLSEAANISHGPVALQQYFGSGGSSVVNHNVTSSITLNTTWTKYTYTTTLPSVAGKTLGTNLCTMMDSDAGKGVEVAQVQLERGSRPTPFEFRSYGEELLASQRFYEKGTGVRANGYGMVATEDSGAHAYINFKAEKRVTPSFSITNVSLGGSPSGYNNGINGYSTSGFGYWYRHGGGSGSGNLRFVIDWAADAEL
jgi:hypothetical protein